MVIGRGYFLHTSSFSENVASARKVPDLSLMKPKVRSGQIRKFSFFDLLDCEQNNDVSVVSCTRYGVCNLLVLYEVFSSFQINSYSVFPENTLKGT